MVNPIAQMRDKKAEVQRGEGPVQGLTAGPALHDLGLVGILPRSLAKDREREVEAQAVGGNMASGRLITSGESFLGGRNCPSFSGPGRPAVAPEHSASQDHFL